MNFENQIQNWISIDNEIKILNEKIKKLRETRNKSEEEIINYASNNGLSNSTIKIKDGTLKLVNTRVQESFTFKYLYNNLGQIIKNETQVKLIMDYLKENRSIKVVPEIKRFYNN